MTLRLEYRGETGVPVEIEGITPDVLRELPLAEIERKPIYHGNRQLPLAEFFRVSGDAADQRMELEGNLAGVHWIGAKMTGGSIHITGSAGRHVGSEMRGGEIVVTENVSDWLGGEMHGGLIRVKGRAGHLVGAAYRGSRKGMTAGTILIGGNAGNEIGHTMRRGLIAIGGEAGDLAGFNLIAGTVLIFGGYGIRHGAGMKRGTIGLLGPQRPEILPTFRAGCRQRPLALDLLLRELRRLDFAVPPELQTAQIDLYSGDWIEGGRGELWVRGGI